MSSHLRANQVPCTAKFEFFLMIKSDLSDRAWDRYLSTVKAYMGYPRYTTLLQTTRNFSKDWYEEFDNLYARTSVLLVDAGPTWGGPQQVFNTRRFLMQTVVHLAGVHHNKMRKAAYRQRKKLARRLSMVAAGSAGNANSDVESGGRVTSPELDVKDEEDPVDGSLYEGGGTFDDAEPEDMV